MPRLQSWVLVGIALAITSRDLHAVDVPSAKRPNLQVELRLHDAVVFDRTPDENRWPLLLLLRQTDDGWQRAWATARDANHSVHSAALDNMEFTEKSFNVDLNVTVFADARSNPGGFATYAVRLERDDNGVYRGTFKGDWLGTTVEGRAEAALLPPVQKPPKGFTPPRLDEHPRILFRRSELPELRRRADTPLGKAALAKMNGVVGLSIKYQLFGDAKYALQVIPLVEKLMERGLVSDQYGNNVGERLEQTALAYDLCYDAWPAGFRRRVESYMSWAARGILRARRDTHQGVNWHCCSNWSAPLYTGAAFAGLALWGKEGPPPPEPPETNTGRRIDPADGYKPGRGVPVFGFQSDQMSPNWIFAGGFATDRFDGDPLKKLGGAANVRPQVGDAVTFGGKTVRFAPVPEEKDKGFWQHENYEAGAKLIDVTNAIGREYFSTSFFYIVVRNDRDRWVRFDPGLHTAAVYLGGVRLERNETAHISAGLYPMLVETYIDQINPWARQLMRPRLVEITEQEAGQLVEEQQAHRAAAVANWERRKAEWERLGRLDLDCRDTFQRSRHMMYVFCREAVGDGGAQAELTHYSGIAEKAPARYMAAHLRMFGYHVSPQDDVESLLSRKMFVHTYPADAEPRAVEINGTPQVSNELFSALLPTVSEKLRPAMLWGWQRHAGFLGDNWVALAENRPEYALLYYPLEMKPAAPGQRMPLTWRADDFGFYGFRNRWAGGDDFVAQVFAKSHCIGGWNAPNAGTFRLTGLGHVWAAGSTDRNRHRWEETVVQLPDDPDVNVGACGRVTHVETRPDGSGVVSIDYADVYAKRRMLSDRPKPMRLYSRYGNIRRDDAFIDSGITGMRSIGVDYSGRSGSPCLVAVVDQIRGGGRKVWTWQLPPGDKETPGDVERTTVEGNSFLVRKDDGATLYGLFATGHRPVAEVYKTTMIGGGGSTSGKTLQRPIHGVFAESKARNDAFFFVATVQKGEPPKIKVQGKGLQAVVTVGKQRVRFDGEKIVLEPGR